MHVNKMLTTASVCLLVTWSLSATLPASLILSRFQPNRRNTYYMDKPANYLRRHARLAALRSANSVNVRALLSGPLPTLLSVR